MYIFYVLYLTRYTYFVAIDDIDINIINLKNNKSKVQKYHEEFKCKMVPDFQRKINGNYCLKKKISERNVIHYQ